MKNKFKNEHFKMIRTGNWLIADFPKPIQTLSWAVLGGGFNTVDQVVWRQVKDRELSLLLNPIKFLNQEIESTGFKSGVDLLTGTKLDNTNSIK